MAKIAIVKIILRGIAPLLMHSERLVDPFDPLVKQIAAINSKKKKKTEEDMLIVQRLEWEGGLYHSEALGPYLPCANIKRSIMDGAAIFRGGVDVKRALLPMEGDVPLAYRGPRDIEGLWKHGGYRDIRSVGINRNKVMRCRPKFPEWGIETQMTLDTNVADLDDFQRYLLYAGKMVGLGDYRPTMGRYMAELEVMEEIDTPDKEEELADDDA